MSYKLDATAGSGRPSETTSILTTPPDRPDRPAQPLRSFLADPIPLLLEALPFDLPEPESGPVEEPGPADPVPSEPAPTPEVPAPGSHPIRETVQAVKETLTPGFGNVADREPDLLQRRDG